MPSTKHDLLMLFVNISLLYIIFLKATKFNDQDLVFIHMENKRI